eukprot:490660_1
MAEAKDEEKKGNDDNKQQDIGFADTFFKTLSVTNKNESNLICSPLSVLTALTICMCGAKDNTLKQMFETLYPNESKQNNTPENAQKTATQTMNICSYYNKEYVGNNDKPILNITNKLWIKKGLKILETYIKSTTVDSIQSLDISNPGQAAVIVNKWFTAQTKNMIKDVVNESIMSNMELLISNAIYFNGKFLKPFPEKNTKEKVPFYSNRRQTKKLGEVTMMNSTNEQWIAEEVKGVWDVVKLQYVNSSLSLYLVINNYGVGNEPVLTANDLLFNLNDYWVESKIRLFVPKFKFEYSIELTDVLKEMGITDAFCNKADFSGITGGKELFISTVIHKAIIEVDEKGTKAAAATAVVMSRCLPSTKRFDHPFTFYIIDEDKKMALFSGCFEGK